MIGDDHEEVSSSCSEWLDDTELLCSRELLGESWASEDMSELGVVSGEEFLSRSDILTIKQGVCDVSKKFFVVVVYAMRVALAVARDFTMAGLFVIAIDKKKVVRDARLERDRRDATSVACVDQGRACLGAGDVVS